MATGFASLITTLEGVDFFTLLLPFLVTYVVLLFGVRQIGHLDDSNVPPVVALAGAFFLAFFLANNPGYQSFFTEYWARIAIGMMGVIGLGAILGIAGWGDVLQKSKPIAIVVLFAGVIVFARTGGLEAIVPLPDTTVSSMVNEALSSPLVWLVPLGIVMYWTRPSDDSSSGDDDSSVMSAMETLLGEDG
ncbi:hypothetical protein [Candidatus Nanohalovita haloferacivicina]|uniref:hypothetical protein n=1 Tax=Candidatus Nanohalovita haloferacivicina TaxID=2978046 RepID=UPI00325FA7F6|nr:hypothetical protein HBNXNv_1086 [Candidatus Nanohalobia archaeon BNXNv]